MKNRRILSAFLAVFLLFLLFTGCAKNPEPVEAPEPVIEGPGLDDLVETDSLVIYIMKANEAWERQLIDRFQMATGVEVEIVSVEGDAFSYAERVMNDLAAGSGPDVLFVEKLSGFDVSKVALTRSFLDLTDILAEDPEFSENDYLDGVLEAGQFGGRQYTMPVAYDLLLAVSPTEVLKELGFDWSGIDTMSDFLEEIARLMPAAEQNPSFQRMLYSKNSLNKLLQASGICLIDYEAGEVLPDEEALREFLEAYKAYFPYDYDEFGGGLSVNIGDRVLTSGQCAFWPPTDIKGLVQTMDILQLKSCEYLYHVIPGQTNAAVGCITSQLAIPANAKNTANAYQFIKFMISEETQSDYYMIGNHPIHKSALQKTVQEAPSVYEANGQFLLDYETPALTDEEAQSLLEVLTGIDQFSQRAPYDLWMILQESMLPFFQDEASYETCLADLKNRLTLYLSE